jgi:hypothetical protein
MMMHDDEIAQYAQTAVNDYVDGWQKKTLGARVTDVVAALKSGKATTVRLCIGCSRVVLHGPTRCDTCAAEVSGT